jgi:hypothetical protein
LLRVYRFSRYQARKPFTIIGDGQAELVELAPERIHLRLQKVAPGTRLKLHVAGFPRWEARLNGREVEIEPATVYGMEYPILMEVPVAEGDLIFRYVRRTPDWAGLALTLLSVLGLATLAWPRLLRRLPSLPIVRRLPPRATRVLPWAAAAGMVVGVLLIAWRTSPAATPSSEPVLDGTWPAPHLSLAGYRCEAQQGAWRCGEHLLSRSVVSGAYGSHVCWNTRTPGTLVITARRRLGKFLQASYDPRVNTTGRIRVFADNEQLGDAPTRGDENGLTFVQADTRTRAGKLVDLRWELEGAALHCFDLRIVR